MPARYPAPTVLIACVSVAFGLCACSNDEGEARNAADKKVSDTAASIQEIALGAAYPTPMTNDEAVDFGTLASSPPVGLTDEQLRTLQAHGSGAFKPLEASKNEYASIVQSFGTIEGTPQQQNAQRAMRANANIGLSAIQLEEAERLDVAMRPDYAIGHTILTSVLDLHSMIASAQTFDPGPLRREYDATSNAARTNLQSNQTEVRNLQRQISDLEKRVSNELASANSLNEQAVKQRENALNAPLNERIAQLEVSKATARRSGDHQVAAARLEAQLDLLRPDLARYEMLVEQDQGQIADMDRALALLDEQTQENARQIAELRRDMGQASGSLSAHLDPLIEEFQSELLTSFDAAAQAANAAASDAQRGSGALQAVTAEQLLGRIEWRRAMALEAMIQLMQRVVENSAALGRSSSDQALLQSFKSVHAEAQQKAQEALQSALDSVDSTPSSGGDMDQRLSVLRASLAQSISYITGQAVAEVRDFSDVPDVDPMDEPTIGTGDASGPRELLRTAQRYEQEGNFGALLKLMYSDSPNFDTAMSRMEPMLASVKRLDNAVRSAFGSSINEAMSAPGGGQGMGGMGSLNSGSLLGIDIDALDIRFDGAGTTAWVDNEPSLADQNMVDVGGQWYFEMPAELVDEMVQAPVEQITAMATMMNNLAEQIENGSITTEDALAQAFMAELMKMMGDPNMQPSGEFGPGGSRRRDRGGGN